MPEGEGVDVDVDDDEDPGCWLPPPITGVGIVDPDGLVESVEVGVEVELEEDTVEVELPVGGICEGGCC